MYLAGRWQQLRHKGKHHYPGGTGISDTYAIVPYTSPHLTSGSVAVATVDRMSRTPLLLCLVSITTPLGPEAGAPVDFLHVFLGWAFLLFSVVTVAGFSASLVALISALELLRKHRLSLKLG